MKSILTVCIGNICRSPMAEGLLAKEFPSIDVSSAGIGALVGHKADPTAVDLMNAKSIDISSHVARQISKVICQGADLILVMDRGQQKLIERMNPSSRGKIFLLAADGETEIPDPYRKDVDAFANALNLIEDGVNAWAERINKLLKTERQLT